LSDVHDVFHVSQLKKCLRVPEEQIPMEDLDAMEDHSYQQYPVKILETSERVTRNKKIKMCKEQWSHHTEEEATWDREEELKAEFPSFFSDPSECRCIFFVAFMPLHIFLGVMKCSCILL
jgi:hypothetical protein